MSKEKKIVLFASGNGTNAENIIRYFQQKEKNISIAGVFTNNNNAGVIKRAGNLNITVSIFNKEDMTSGKLLSQLIMINPDLIVLAGFMLKIPKSLILAFPSRIINIHPALLPLYGGKGMYGSHVHKAVIEAKEKESGITIHYVNEEYDAGDIIFQAKVPVLEEDSPETLAEKIHNLEYRYFPEIIEKLLN